LTILGFSNGNEPSRRDIQQRFRDLVREAHPDHGGESDGAGQRMVDLSEARRILLGSA
jgi:DnaJ-class molecular chaperone